ncbi:MAG: hypothetical protein AMXMBFR4_33710 [Candidatus Hydrogenedentota bacterium]
MLYPPTRVCVKNPDYLAAEQSGGLGIAVWDMYATQVRNELPDLSDRAVNIAVARRVYAGDQMTQKLLDTVELHGGD